MVPFLKMLRTGLIILDALGFRVEDGAWLWSAYCLGIRNGNGSCAQMLVPIMAGQCLFAGLRVSF